jgi:flagellar hook-associated protein 3 FlgL
MRLGTANTYDNTLVNLTTRQAGLSDLQEKLSAGKRVVRASDDPTGAAQAERALTRIERVDTEQRALNIQRNAIQTAEFTLGDSIGALQRLRELVIQAGNGALTAADRNSVATEMRGLRDQLFGDANKQDSNGIPLFSGLGSIALPFTDVVTGVTLNALPGQKASTTVSIPGVLDGEAAWMSVPTGNGVFKIALGAGNSGGVSTSVGQVTNPSLLSGNNYSVTFNVNPVTGATTYDIVNTTTAASVATGQPYVDGQAIQFDGLSFTVQGAPANGDTLAIAPSTETSLFTVLDAAINSIDKSGNTPALNQALGYALTELDAGMSRLQSARGFAGDLLNRADSIDARQQAKSLLLTADRSRAEDMDMVKGISEFQNQQTGYEAALKTYAQVQRLSLFNYLG